MLAERGILDPAAAETAGARHRPEVLALRFHPEISPIEALPRDLRGPLVRLLLEEAEGAVRRVGRSWERFDPLAPEHLAMPSRHEVPAAGATGAGTTSEYVLGELTWTRARERFAETDTALLPVGAIEQHGPHLPLDTDAWDADYLCREVARRCTDPKPIVLPLISYGVSYHHDDFPGTLSVSPETLAQLVYEVGMSAVAHGVRKLVVVNGHGGNSAALQLAAQKLNRDARIFTAVDTGESSDTDIARITVTRNDAHAGEVETSTALATRSHLVAMDRARRDVPRFSSRYLDFSSEHGIPWFAHTRRLSSSGVLGDPTQASAEKGVAIWALMIDHLVAFVEQLKGMSLDEIHERRL
jgi:creatinine amidohydrolase/Fe(II)-dependent formamide hydrolase-like protein